MKYEVLLGRCFFKKNSFKCSYKISNGETELTGFQSRQAAQDFIVQFLTIN